MVMRLDYALYALAAVFFVATAVSFSLLTGTQRNLSVVSTVVLGLLALGLGYSQRPRISVTPPPAVSFTAQTTSEPAMAAPQSAPEPQISTAESPNSQEPNQEEGEIMVAPTHAIQAQPEMQPQPIMEVPASKEAIAPVAPAVELTQIKGIKDKRAAQLKMIGINNIDELAKASAKEIASKLQISPKIVEKWITGAKELAK